MSLLLPDHDTKGSCVFKIDRRDPNARGARALSHSDPLHPVLGDGGCFRRGPGGSFRLDEPRPPLHSHRGGIATKRWPADAHLEVRRRFVNSLLERLRRRLRELGRPLHEEPSSDGRRPSSRATADDAPQCRTEIELSQRSRNADRTGSGEPARLPAQQPPPPTSTRLKAAVFSKKRHPTPQRQAGSIWGPTSFLDVGNGARGAEKAGRSTLLMLEADPVTTGPGSSAEVMSWSTRPPSTAAEAFSITVDPGHPQWWIPEQSQPPANVPDTLPPMFSGGAPIAGAPALVTTPDATQPVSVTLQIDLAFGSAPPALTNWRGE